MTGFPGPRLSVTGCPAEPGEPSFFPFTVSTIPPGLPMSMFTERSNVHDFELPPTMYAWVRNRPSGLVNSTQQSWMAVRLITTFCGWVTDGVADGVAAGWPDFEW